MVYRIRDLVKVRETEGAEFRLVVPQLTITEGEKIALVGHIGAGKTTKLSSFLFAQPYGRRISHCGVLHREVLCAIAQQKNPPAEDQRGSCDGKGIGGI